MLLNYLNDESMEEGILDSFVNARNKDNQTPLMVASWENYYSLIELLVKAGADINVSDKDDDTAISLITMKISKEKSKSFIPNSKESPNIHQVYTTFNIALIYNHSY